MISVIVPTYNRAREIPDTLNCLLKQDTRGAFVYEIIVVDNNSGDTTQAVVDGYAARFPGQVRYVFEPSPGVAHAVNAGLRTAQGDIIVRTDDDCMVETDYLWQIHQAFSSQGPDVGVVGGPVYPHWLGGRCPAWFETLSALPSKYADGSYNWLKIGFQGTLGILDLGSKAFYLNGSGYQFFGANIALRRSMVNYYGAFDTQKKLGEDTEICDRLFNAGIKGYYVPEIKVFHKTPVSKVSPFFYYRWWYGRGIIIDVKEEYQRKFYHPFGIRLSFIFKTLRMFLGSFFIPNLYERIHARNDVAFNVGQMVRIMRHKMVDERRGMVSVVMIFLNGEPFITEAIESVIAQVYTNWELILVDDGSTDDSSSIAKEYAKRYPGKIRYLEHPGHANRGKSASRNLGVTQAHGEYIALLDADDVYLPEKLERQVAILEQYPDAGMVYGITRYWYSWTKKSEDANRDWFSKLGVTPRSIIGPPRLVTLYLNNGDYVPCTCGWLIRKSAIPPDGGSELAFRDLYEDQVFLAKIILKYPAYIDDGCWDNYRQHVNMTSNEEYTKAWKKNPKSAYLEWLAGYIRKEKINDPDLRAALKRERAMMFPVTHPLIYKWMHTGPVAAAKKLLRKLLPEGLVQRIKRRIG